MQQQPWQARCFGERVPCSAKVLYRLTGSCEQETIFLFSPSQFRHNRHETGQVDAQGKAKILNTPFEAYQGNELDCESNAPMLSQWNHGLTKGYERTMNEKTRRGGRPRLPIDAATVAQLRDAGHSWRSIARQIGAGCATVRRAYQSRAKTVPKPIPGPSAISPDCQKAEIPVFGFVRVKRRRWFLIALLAFLAVSVARGQGGGVPASPITIVDSLGRPRAGVTVTICTSTGTGIPCTPLASIFTDAGLTVPASNPVTTDGQGNLPVFYAADGVYKYTVSGSGITPSGPFTATVSLVNGSAATHTSVTSASPNPAQSGVLRLASPDSIAWRNNANTADTSLAKLGAASGGVPTDTFQFQNATGAAPIWGFPVIASSSVALGVPVTGAVRLSTTDTITWRNNAGTGDVAL